MIVLDTSFIIKLLKREITIDLLKNDEKLITTDLFDYEFANVMWKTAKRQDLSVADVRKFFTAIEALDIERHKSDSIKLFLYAAETGLTAYDASYLLLARRHKCPIATFDKQLVNIANKEGIAVIPQ